MTSKRLLYLYSNRRTSSTIHRTSHRRRTIADENRNMSNNVMKKKKISLSLTLMRLTVHESAIDQEVFASENKTE